MTSPEWRFALRVPSERRDLPLWWHVRGPEGTRGVMALCPACGYPTSETEAVYANMEDKMVVTTRCQTMCSAVYKTVYIGGGLLGVESECIEPSYYEWDSERNDRMPF